MAPFAANDLSLPAQWAFAAPFLVALGVVGKWLLSRLDALQTELSSVNNKIIDQVIPALDSASEASRQVMTMAKDMQAALLAERELRLKAEGRAQAAREGQ